MRLSSGPLAAAIGVVVLLQSARRARTHGVGTVEERVFRKFNRAPDAVHVPVWVVMQSGSLAAVFVVAGQLLLGRRARVAVVTAIAGTAVWGGVKLVKPLVGRGRPEHHLDGVLVRGQPQTGLGYPSGHSAVALTLALVATRDRSPVVRIAAMAVAGATGGARMYVGAHLPLDVAGGLAIGILSGRAVNAVVEPKPGHRNRS